jgi:hypothetical protein
VRAMEAHVPAVRTWRAAAGVAEREAFMLPVLAMLLVAQQLQADSWLTLVSGREIVEHGLPSVDSLATWTQGSPWVDQQWLAQLIFYGLTLAGGVKLALIANVTFVAGAFILAAAAARSLGASTRGVAFTTLGCFFVSLWAYQLRSQSLVYPLFVGLLWLLAADSRNPTNRVLLALPAIAVWANLHGSVLLAAGLVMLRGLTLAVGEVRTGRLRRNVGARAAALVLAPPLLVFASPYGFDLVGYYRRLILNPTLSELVVEWQPSTPSALTAAFYVVAFTTVWLVARHGARLTGFERLTIGITLVAGLLAIRSTIWFALTVAVLAPSLVDAALPSTDPRAAGVVDRVVAAVSVGAVVVFLVAAVRPADLPASSTLPPRAADVVASAVARDRSLVVFATEPYADWLLWQRPELAGRIAFDVRFELFSEEQFQAVVDVYRRAEGWRRHVAGYGLFVLEPERKALAEKLLGDPSARLLYTDGRVVVLSRPVSR